MFSGVPKWFLAAQPSPGAPAVHNSGVKFSESGIRQGLSCFERALATDSNYPEPHAGLAEAYVLLSLLGYARPADVMVKAKAEAVRALGMDETTSDAHVSLGLVRHWYDWDFAGAEQSYRRAAELNPADPIPRAYLGVLLGETGRPAGRRRCGVADRRPIGPLVSIRQSFSLPPPALYA